MDPMTWMTWMSLLLSAVSMTLAVLAIIFGWVTFKNSNKAQMKAQEILYQVDERLNIIVMTQNKQLDKTIDCLISRSPNEGKIETPKEVFEIIKRYNNELKNEIQQIIRESGGSINNNVEKNLNKISSENESKISRIALETTFLSGYKDLELLIRRIAECYGLGVKGKTLPQMLKLIPDDMRISSIMGLFIMKLSNIRNKLLHSDEKIEDETMLDSIDTINRSRQTFENFYANILNKTNR